MLSAALVAASTVALYFGMTASAMPASVGDVSVFPGVVRPGQTGLSVSYTFHSSSEFTGDIFIEGNPFNGTPTNGSCNFDPYPVPIDYYTTPGTFDMQDVMIDPDDDCGFAFNATAPSTSGLYPITSYSEASGTFTREPLSGSPTVDVLAADGSGTMQVSPTTTAAASTGNTYTLTYTADPGGLVGGELTVNVPAGFSAPSTTGTDPGYTTSTCGTVTPTGQEIDLTNVTLAGGNSCTITYGDTGGGGTGASANTTYGANSFSTQEESGDGGTLTAIASSPSVFVTPASLQVTDSLGGGHVTAGSSFDITVTAKDAQGATLTSYTGQVDFSSSDSNPSVNLPSSYSFIGGDNGVHTFSNGVTLVTAGAQTVTATDHAHNSITSTDNVTVDHAAATHLKVTGATTLAAGSADGVTLTALDPYGNVDTSITGNKNVTIGGTADTSPAGGAPFWLNKDGAGQLFGNTAMVTFASGVATQSTGGASASQLDVTLKDAENATITATDTDDGLSATGGNALSVTVTPLTATHFSVDGTTSWTAGDTHTMTVTALDVYGNTDTSYDSGSGCTALTWSGAGTSPGGDVPAAGGCTNNSSGEANFGQTSYSDFSAGVASVPLTLYKWQFAFPSVTDGSISTTSPPQIGVDPAGTDHFVVAGSGTQTAGQSQDLTITAADPYGNQEPGYNGEHDLTFSGADNSPNGTLPTVTDNTGAVVNAFASNPVALTFDTGVASAGAGTGAGQLHMKLYDKENADVSVTDGTYSGSLNVAVADAGVDHFNVAGSASQTAGQSQLITITALDEYDNYASSFDGFASKEIEVTGASNAPNGSVPYFTGNSGQGSVQIPFGSCSDPSNASGITFSGGVGDTNITLYKAETADIRVTDCQSGASTPDGRDRPVDVSAASATQFAITHTPAKVSQNGTFTVTTSALDTYENVTTTTGDEHYTLSTTDGTGTLGGTTTGTILSGDSGDTLNGVTYDTQETIHLRATGDLATSAASAGINVDSPDGSGTMVPLTTHVVPGSTGNELSFRYTPATSMDTGSVSLVVPADWPAPSTNPTDPGYTTTGCSSCGHAGDVAVTGQTITVTNIQADQPIYVQYGYQGSGGPGATAPATSEAETWTASSQQDSDSGSLQPLDTSPTVDVDSPDGSGTLGVSPGDITAGSTGNDLTLTYTAGTGGIGDGSITIAHPSGWTAFSAGSTDTSDCSGCTVSYPSGNLELDNVTLASGAELTIDYTATASEVAGTTSFSTQEASSSGGTLSDLAAAQQVHVYPAALSHYGIAASTSQTASAEQGLIVVAQDEYGNLESSGPNDVSGDVSLTFSGADTAPDGVHAPTVTDKNGDAVAFGDPTVVTFTDGEAEGDGTQLDMTLYDAEAASIAVTDGTSSSFGLGITVSPASFAGFTVQKSTGGAIGTQRSGVAFVVKATAVDSYDNTETGYTGPVDFSTSDAACDGGCNSNVGGFSGGVVTHAFTLDRSGTGVTVSVADHADNSKSGTSAAFLLVPNHFVLTLSDAATTTAGNAQDLTVTAKDSDGTTAASYRGTVHFGSSDGGASVDIPSDYTFTGGDGGVHTFSGGVTLTTAGDQTVTATDAGFGALTGTADQDVLPAAATQVTFTSSGTDVVSGATKTLTAELRDPYANLVDSNASVTFSHTSGTGTVTGLSAVAAVHGVATDVVTGALAGSVTITASSGVLGQDTSSFSVLPGTPTQLAFTSSTANLASGSSRTLTAQIEDANGNVVPVASQVTFAQTAGTGTVTGLGKVASAAGIASKSVTGKLAGSITVTASAGALSTTTTFAVVPGDAVKLVFTSSTASLTSGSARNLTVLVKDAAGNVVSSDGGHSVTFTKSGGVGTVSGLGGATTSSGGAADEVTGVTAGSLTIRASSSGLTAATATIKIVPGNAAKLVFTSSAAALTVGHARELTVEVEDAAGNLQKSQAVTVRFAECSGSGAVSGLPQSPTSSNGKAAATVTASEAGPITICATADGLSTGSTSFTIKAAPHPPRR